MSEQMNAAALHDLAGAVHDIANRRAGVMSTYEVANLEIAHEQLNRFAKSIERPVPTTAEPMRAAQSDGGDRLIEFAEEMLGVPLEPWQMRLCRRVFGGNVGRSTGRPDAAPPSVTDMMPGTTFWARTKWGHEWPFVAEGGNAVRANVSGYPDGILLHEFDIDPSTIRDVTPPQEHR